MFKKLCKMSNFRKKKQQQLCFHFRGHCFGLVVMKLCQNVYIYRTRPSLQLGHVGSKTRSLGQIVEKPCVNSRYAYPANRKRYHNVSIWLYVGLVATQHRLNLTMTFAMSCRKVMLKPTIGKRCCNV